MDPRLKKAEQLRDDVLQVLQPAGASFRQLLRDVRLRAVAREVSDRQLDAALQALRRSGRVRFRRPLWEAVR